MPIRRWCSLSEPATELGSEFGAHVSGDDNRSRLEDSSFPHTRARAAVMEESYAKTKTLAETQNRPIAQVVEPNAAGIDSDATEIFVAVPADRDAQPVRCFATFTCELEEIATWLKACGIESVVMESTGVFWIPLVQILEDVGCESG